MMVSFGDYSLFLSCWLFLLSIDKIKPANSRGKIQVQDQRAPEAQPSVTWSGPVTGASRGSTSRGLRLHGGRGAGLQPPRVGSASRAECPSECRYRAVSL